MSKQESICQNIRKLRETIALQIEKHRPDRPDVQIMAVSKRASVEDILYAHYEGINLFGENYIQPAIDKLQILFKNHALNASMFHFIGHLQSNKLNKAMEFFSSIDAVDSLDLAQKISLKADHEKRLFPVFLEVNTSDESAKFGFNPDNILLFMDKIVFLENIKVSGLMTMGLLNGNELEIRSSFARLRLLKEEIERRFALAPLLLSMGMSEDYEWAIQEGSDLIRIGRGIFGEESVGNE